MFQSLLSWISRFGNFGSLKKRGPYTGFNPCCLGLAVLAYTPGVRAGLGQNVSILVVLD